MNQFRIMTPAEQFDPDVGPRLRFTKEGKVQLSEYNLGIILEHDPALRGKYKWNICAGQVYIDAMDLENPGIKLEDHHEQEVLMYLSEQYNINPTVKRVGNVLRWVARKNSYDPIKEYIESLPPWDEVERLDRLLLDQFNASTDTGGAEELTGEDMETLLKAMSRKFFISAIARGLDPGCKADCSLMLSGEQGQHKSTACAALMPSRSLFLDTKIKLGDRDGEQVLQGRWLVEIKELAGFKGKQAAAVKAYLDEQIVSIRPQHGRHFGDVPRRCVFIGTTNEATPLNDPTGSRRYWVVKVRDIDIAFLKAWRDEIWAEALAAYRAGEQWWLSKDEEKLLQKNNSNFQHNDEWSPIVERYMVANSDVTIMDILTTRPPNGLGLSRREAGLSEQRRVGNILRMLGFSKKQKRMNGGKTTIWIKK